jgi:predicted porin
MKKSLVALAVLSTVAGTAAAQSSVTLFGVMDVAARYNKAGGRTLSSLGTDGQSASRLGVRGVEDLGGGMKTTFWLESQLAADTGTAGDSTSSNVTPANASSGTKLWNRRATISLSGDFGEVRLGRDKTSERNLIDEFDVYGTVGLGDITKVYSTLGSGSLNINRSDNMVRYFLPSNLGGFYGSFDVAAGEGVAGQKFYGGRFGYKQGPWNVSAGGQVTYTTVANSGAKWGLGSIAGSYDFDVAKVALLFTESKYAGRTLDSWTANASVPVGQGVFKLSYTYSNANDTAQAAKFYSADLVTAAYVYNLSKRTSLYTTVSKLQNKGAGKLYLAPEVVPAANNTMLPSAGGGAGGFDVGITHSF